MTFTLTIECDNAAFEDGEEQEVARILKAVALRVRQGASYGVAMDENGNKVGQWSFGD